MNCAMSPLLPTTTKTMTTTNVVVPGNRTGDGGRVTSTQKNRRVSSSALYEVWRKDLNDVCYLFVPDEYDLVKSHLMFAVREEVEVLKEKISELMERISQLEMENAILKANATQETLAQIQSSKFTGGNSNNS